MSEAFLHRWRDEPAGPVERVAAAQHVAAFLAGTGDGGGDLVEVRLRDQRAHLRIGVHRVADAQRQRAFDQRVAELVVDAALDQRSEEHTSELQSLMRISYAVFCLKKKT